MGYQGVLQLVVMMKQAAGFLNKRTFWLFIVNPDWSPVGKHVSKKMERI